MTTELKPATFPDWPNSATTPTIYAAVCRALGSGSPEAKAEPENDPKTLRAAMNRAREEIRGMRKEFGNPDSDYGAGAKEACDRIAAALVIAE